jgi:hypothetical protein
VAAFGDRFTRTPECLGWEILWANRSSESAEVATSKHRDRPIRPAGYPGIPLSVHSCGRETRRAGAFGAGPLPAARATGSGFAFRAVPLGRALCLPPERPVRGLPCKRGAFGAGPLPVAGATGAGFALQAGCLRVFLSQRIQSPWRQDPLGKPRGSLIPGLRKPRVVLSYPATRPRADAVGDRLGPQCRSTWPVSFLKAGRLGAGGGSSSDSAPGEPGCHRTPEPPVPRSRIKPRARDVRVAWRPPGGFDFPRREIVLPPASRVSAGAGPG